MCSDLCAAICAQRFVRSDLCAAICLEGGKLRGACRSSSPQDCSKEAAISESLDRNGVLKRTQDLLKHMLINDSLAGFREAQHRRLERLAGI